MNKISVVVLTKNSQKHLKECLKSILLQEYPDFEVIVVDAMSTDGTYGILTHYSRLSDVPFRIIDVNSDTSIGKARQIGVEKSRGEIIAFIDSDVELPSPNWLENMMRPLTEGYRDIPSTIVEMIIGGVQTLSKTRDTDPLVLKWIHSRFEYKDNIIDKNHYEMVGTGHLLIRKDLIEEAGGFRDIRSSEDLDMTKRIMETGYKFIYLPEEKVYHYHVDGWWQYITKHLIRNKLLALRRIFIEHG